MAAAANLAVAAVAQGRPVYTGPAPQPGASLPAAQRWAHACCLHSTARTPARPGIDIAHALAGAILFACPDLDARACLTALPVEGIIKGFVLQHQAAFPPLRPPPCSLWR